MSGGTWSSGSWSGRAAGTAALVAAVLAAGAGPSLAATAPLSSGGSAVGGTSSVVVQAVPGRSAEAAEAVRRAGGQVTRTLPIIDGFAARVPAGAVRMLASAEGVRTLTPDVALQLLSTGYDPTQDDNALYRLQNVVGTRTVWDTWTGAGVDVALIDSGVAPVAGLSDAGKLVQGPDLTPESQDASTRHLDTYGHGTHMAGIIAGRDSGVDPATSAADTGSFLGAAPDARIVALKVADAHGSTDVTQVIAALDWVVQHAHDPGLNIRVVNLSFGTNSTQDYALDPLAYAAEQAWKHGLVVVVSAGNSGSADGRLTNPAADPYVLAVGAADTHDTSSSTDDTIPEFSSRGDGVRDPDLVAPGTHVQSLRVPGSYVDVTHGDTGYLDERYFRGSGTSQAAAFVSGSVAQLLQQHPDYTPDEIKALLTGTAKPLPAADRQAQGAGLIDMRAATGSYDVDGSTQSHPSSTGSGTLDGARGDAVLELDEVPLTGQQDIFGQPFDSAAMAAAQAAGTAWTGGSWNGTEWTGTGFADGSWAGRTWSGSDWSGRTWSGRTWSSGSWDGRTWSDASWTGRTWSGARWSGRTWSGRTWSGRTWSEGSWS